MGNAECKRRISSRCARGRGDAGRLRRGPVRAWSGRSKDREDDQCSARSRERGRGHLRRVGLWEDQHLRLVRKALAVDENVVIVRFNPWPARRRSRSVSRVLHDHGRSSGREAADGDREGRRLSEACHPTTAKGFDELARSSLVAGDPAAGWMSTVGWPTLSLGTCCDRLETSREIGMSVAIVVAHERRLPTRCGGSRYLPWSMGLGNRRST